MTIGTVKQVLFWVFAPLFGIYFVLRVIAEFVANSVQSVFYRKQSVIGPEHKTNGFSTCEEQWSPKGMRFIRPKFDERYEEDDLRRYWLEGDPNNPERDARWVTLIKEEYNAAFLKRQPDPYESLFSYISQTVKNRQWKSLFCKSGEQWRVSSNIERYWKDERMLLELNLMNGEEVPSIHILRVVASELAAKLPESTLGGLPFMVFNSVVNVTSFDDLEFWILVNSICAKHGLRAEQLHASVVRHPAEARLCFKSLVNYHDSRRITIAHALWNGTIPCNCRAFVEMPDSSIHIE